MVNIKNTIFILVICSILLSGCITPHRSARSNDFKLTVEKESYRVEDLVNATLKFKDSTDWDIDSIVLKTNNSQQEYVIDKLWVPAIIWYYVNVTFIKNSARHYEIKLNEGESVTLQFQIPNNVVNGSYEIELKGVVSGKIKSNEFDIISE